MCHTTSQHPMACHIIHTVTAPNHSLPHVPYYYTLPCGTLQITATPSKLTVPPCKCTNYYTTTLITLLITSHYSMLPDMYFTAHHITLCCIMIPPRCLSNALQLLGNNVLSTVCSTYATHHYTRLFNTKPHHMIHLYYHA